MSECNLTGSDTDLESVIKMAEECSLCTPTHADTVLRANGYTELGAGHFSTVYGRLNSKYAIKVCKRDRDSWPFFAKYCIDNKDNPKVNFILPTVHKFIKSVQRGLYVAVLDRLKGYVIESSGISHTALTSEQSDHVRAVFRAFSSYDYYYGEERGEYAVNRAFSYFLAADMVREDLEQFCSLDLHGYNIMQDSSGNLMLTDPVSFSSSQEKADETLNELDPRPKSARVYRVKVKKSLKMPSLRRPKLSTEHELLRCELGLPDIKEQPWKDTVRDSPKANQCTFVRQKIHKHKRF